MIKKKTTITYMTILILLTILLGGLTYAYYRTRIIGNNSTEPSISIQSKNMEIVYEDGNAIFSTEGKINPGFTYTKTFYVKNTGNESVTYSVILEEMINDFDRNQDWQVILTKNGTDIISEDDNVHLAVGRHQVLLASETIEPTNTDEPTIDTYVLTVTYLISDEDQSEDMGRTLLFKVNIKEEQYLWKDAPSGSLLYELKTNQPNEDNAKVIVTEDDYGMSYIYQGEVENNYVNYSGMCWRVLRVQGDGTIKLVLADEHGECDADTYSIKNKGRAFINNGTEYYFEHSDNNKYVNSNIHQILTNWKNKKVKDASKLVETDWCDDSSGGIDRVFETINPNLKCSFNEDDFLINEIERYESDIGLLTADEVVFARGGEYVYGKNFYLITSIGDIFYWTMTGYGIGHFLVLSDGSLYTQVDGDYGGIRPVIVLRNDVLVTYDDTNEETIGTYQNPYKII